MEALQNYAYQALVHLRHEIFS